MGTVKNEIVILKKKVTRNYRDHGFFVCLKKSIFYLAKSRYEKSNVILFRTDIKSISEKELYQNSFDYKLVESKDTYIIKQIEEMEEWLTGKLTSSLGNKKLCMAALKDEKVIGFYLISIKDIYLPLLHLKVLLKSNEAFGEQITVLKKFRRKGFGTELRFMTYLELKKRGAEKIYSTASVDNYASLKSIEKGGGKRIGQLLYKKSFNSKQLRLLKNSGQKIFKEAKADSRRQEKNNEKYYFLTDTSNFNS
jgi:RimJ/RimL family protein N-acetyltransferase